MFSRQGRKKFKRFWHSLLKIFSIVLIWRGAWYIFDRLDASFFGGSHFGTAIASVLLGILIIFAIDEELEELV